MQDHADHKMKGHYVGLAFELTAHFIVMYLVMYTMIATLDHLYLNINNIWMTLMMVTPMALIMMASMRSMFPSQKLNIAIIAGAVLVFAGRFYAMRIQAAAGNEQFLKSMIPHHSGAILMCEQASITDPEIVALCGEIVPSQRAEIERMRAILDRY